jgi:hypothetical protein
MESKTFGVAVAGVVRDAQTKSLWNDQRFWKA